MQKELEAAVAQARASEEVAEPVAGATPTNKAKGRRDLSACTLPRFLLEIRDEELERTAKYIGYEDTLHFSADEEGSRCW